MNCSAMVLNVAQSFPGETPNTVSFSISVVRKKLGGKYSFQREHDDREVEIWDYKGESIVQVESKLFHMQ